ncbi:hypothetical protein [Geoglobus acetivorans]
MGLNNRNVPIILLISSSMITGAGYWMAIHPIKISISTVTLGLHIFAIGVLLFALSIVVIVYEMFIKKEIERRVPKNDRNQYMASYIAGVYGGLTVYAINFVLSSKSFSGALWAGTGFFFLFVVMGLFGLTAFAFILEK